jgi:monothiol glutaredoxin
MIDHSKEIEKLIKENKIFIFMKGDREHPLCGFSAIVMHIFKELKVGFSTFDVLSDQGMRQAIKDFTGWPTIPQIFINGEFIGGSDIAQELYESGELQKMVQ